MEETNDKLQTVEDAKIQKHPGYAEITDNILFVLKEIVKGNTSPSEIAIALKNQGIEWSRSKLSNSYNSAMAIINDDVKAMKGATDQRFIQLKKVKEIQQSEWNEVLHMIEVRNTAFSKLDMGVPISDLKIEEQQMISVTPEKFKAVTSKAKTVILQAINSENEILGYKTDKTIIFQSTNEEQQKMLSHLNEQFKRKFRDVYATNDEEVIDVEATEVQDG